MKIVTDGIKGVFSKFKFNVGKLKQNCSLIRMSFHSHKFGIKRFNPLKK